MDAFVFPGQGSQQVGMGRGLFDEVEEFQLVEKEINEILGYSVRKLCLEDPDRSLNQTQFTQPCLYVVNALHYYRALSEGRHPRLLAGHSLGEYNALLAAGVFDFLTGLRLVQKRGDLMSKASSGSMAAVVGLQADQVTQLVQDKRLVGIDIANFNGPSQTVISGPADEIERAAASFQGAGATYIPLRVSAAFHSRHMKDAASEFEGFLSQFAFSEPKIPVISNVTARPYPIREPEVGVRELLVKQISSPVLWVHTVRYLIGRGTAQFHEIGPGTVLKRLIEQITKAA